MQPEPVETTGWCLAKVVRGHQQAMISACSSSWLTWQAKGISSLLSSKMCSNHGTSASSTTSILLIAAATLAGSRSTTPCGRIWLPVIKQWRRRLQGHSSRLCSKQVLQELQQPAVLTRCKILSAGSRTSRPAQQLVLTAVPLQEM